MTNDTGFAPNPFHGFLTLANCKQGIRRTKNENDWIAGFTSKKLNGFKVEEGKLIYLMKVSKKIPYYEYWTNPEYDVKKPSQISKIKQAGDNIYIPLTDDIDRI